MSSSLRRCLGLAVPALLAAAPWLNPFTLAPSPQVLPWLVSMACGIGLWTVAWMRGCPARIPPGLAWACAALVAWAVLVQSGVRPETVMLAAALALLLLSAAAAGEPGTGLAMQAGFLLAAAVSAVLGLCQYFGVAATLGPWVSPANEGQAFANLRQTNQYATFCWIGAAIVLWGGARLPRAARAALMVLLAAGCAASVSRTGMLQAAVLFALAVVWAGPGSRERLALGGLGLAAYAAASWGLPLLLEAAGGVPSRTLWGRLGAEYGCASRRVLWANVVHLIAQKPLAGWGWGELDFAHYLTLYPGPRFCEIADNAHNLPLHLAVELGLPAAFLICAGGVAWVWRQAPWNEEDPTRRLAWALLALILVHSLLEYPLWYGPFQIAAGAALGWLLARPVGPGAAIGRRPRAALAAVLLAATAYASWDYLRVSQIYAPPEQRRAAWQEDTLAHVRASWLFAGPAGFADLTLAAPTRANAAWMYALSRQVLHYSPEPRVIERLVASATYLGRDDEAVFHLARFRAAFPKDYEAWKKERSGP